MANLYALIDEVHAIIYRMNQRMNKFDIITNASKGMRQYKEILITQIEDLLKSGKISMFNAEEIDDLIKQYYINYYEPLYDGRVEEFRRITDGFRIREDSPLDAKINRLAKIIYQEAYGLSIIDELADGPPFINEVGCNGAHYVWVQVGGIKEYLPKYKFKDEAHLREVIKRAISFDAKADLNEASPEVLCQRADGSRVTALCPPYSGYYQLNIRKFNVNFKSKEELIRNGTSSEEFETFIDNITPGRPNLLIIGDQGTGKTTYLLRYIDSIPDHLAIATIETMFELNADLVYGDRKNIVKLQVLKQKDIEQAFATCLRLGRDIIITGEIREPAEALVTLKSMLRQGRGSCGTFHSTSPRQFIYDFRNLLLQSGFYTNERIAEIDVARAVDIIIHLKLNRTTGKRFINEVCEMVYDDDKKSYSIETIFKYDINKEKLLPVKRVSNIFIDKMREYDITDENIKIINSIFDKYNCK